MFERIKIAVMRGKISRTDQAKSYDLKGKPFSQALLSRASHYQDNAIHEYRELGGRKPFAEDKTLEQFAASCAVTMAYDITSQSLENIGRSRALDFKFYEAPSNEAPTIVAFSLFIVAGIHGQLKAEEIEIDLREATMDTANLFYLGRSDKEGAKYAMEGIEMFQALVHPGDQENAKKWHCALMDLIPMYVFQWTTDKSDLRKVDLIPQFGILLSNLLNVVEVRVV